MVDENETSQPNAATKKGVKAQREKAKSADQLSQEFWQDVLRDPQGQKEIWALMCRAGTFTPPFATGPNGFPQPNATWFKAGQQALGLELYQKLLRLDPNGALAMLKACDTSFKVEL